jgi:hypothetical protein
MSSSRRTVWGCGLAIVALLAGEVSAQTAPTGATSPGPATTAVTAPEAAPTPAVRVTFSPKGAGLNDIPLGGYRVPDTNIIISGHQKGGAAGLLFGPVGMLAQGAVNAQVGKDAVSGTQSALRFDVPKQAEDDMRAVLQSGQYGQAFTLDGANGGTELTVYAYASITFVNDTDARPYVILKAVPKSQPSGGRLKPVRYICCVGEALPLAGDQGLAANGGERLQQILKHETDEAVKLMLTDVRHPYPRDDQSQISVDSHFPFVRQRFRVTGYALADDPDAIVFAPHLSNMIVFAGVMKMDKAAITYHLATKQDSPFKILPD